MPEITKYDPGVPCWADVASPDIPASSAFYEGLFGWTADDQGEEAGHYTMFTRDGRNVAALGPQQDPNIPPTWTTYIATDDADATCKRAEAAGGMVFVPPFDVFDAGRMSIVADAVGAVFGVWQAKEHIGAQLVNEPGTIVWNELAVRDIDAAVPFYESVFGYGITEGAPGSHGDMVFRELQVSGRTVAGVIQMTEDWPAEVPPHWMPYFSVADVDATAGRVRELGGNVNVGPEEIPPGRFAVVSDPVGAHFSVLTMKAGYEL